MSHQAGGGVFPRELRVSEPNTAKIAFTYREKGIPRTAHRPNPRKSPTSALAKLKAESSRLLLGLDSARSESPNHSGGCPQRWAHMHHITGRLTLFMVLVGGTTAFAQSLPTSQPNVLTIFREEVKIGHDADHVKTE